MQKEYPMRILTAALIFVMLVAGTALAKDAYTRGHARIDRAYAEPHQRVVQNNTRNDSWSAKRNTNTYTGQPRKGHPNHYDLRFNNQYGPVKK
jgi:hypothetical protein